jgi:glycosyltransferase involved in cell wall biosynthesis
MGDAGVYARPGDATDFAAGIEALLNDRERMRELSRRVREKADRDHSWLSRGEELVAIYRQLTNSALTRHRRT